MVLGEYDRSAEEGPEQHILVNPEDIFVHPGWNDNCVSCGYVRYLGRGGLNCSAKEGLEGGWRRESSGFCPERLRSLHLLGGRR